MKPQDYQLLKLSIGVLATVGLYSVLYRETKLYRFFEHIYLGLAAGFSIVAIWTEILQDKWWNQMVGTFNDVTHVPETAGHWIYAILLPIGLMGYFVFSKKNNWMSRIPIGMLLGFGAGQGVQVWWNQWGPQIRASMLPIWPTTWSSITVPSTAGLSPERLAEIQNAVYPTQALSNAVFLLTMLSAMSYFFFSLEVKNRVWRGFNTTGRWLLMVGFGAIFGSTVMARFALVIDRMAFIFLEFFRDGLLPRIGH